MYRLIKRLFDIISSTVALLVLSPVFLFAAVGVKLSSKGPVFYRSERIGLDEKPFMMYKFRSMHEVPKNYKNENYLADTDRIFKFGAFLRKSKIDELPQLINVLIADMSVVGPRPYPAAVIKQVYQPEDMRILSVRPGLSCLDSLFDYCHGELFTDDEKKFREFVVPVRKELAKIYIDNKNLILDCKIILRTVFLVLRITVAGEVEFPYTAFEKEAIEKVDLKTVTN